MDQQIEKSVFGEGTPFHMVDEVVSYPPSERFAPHHDGVKYKTFPNMFQTLPAMYALWQMRDYGEKDFLVSEDERLTFSQAFGIAEKISAALAHEYNVKPGDRITICMKNNAEYLIAFIAATSMGAIAIPMNSLWTKEELEYGLDDSGSKVVFCDDLLFSRLQPLLEDGRVGSVQTVVVCGSDSGKSNLIPVPRILTFETLVDKGEDKEVPSFIVEKTTPAAIFYTSGSTGFPKGVILTHFNIAHSLVSAMAHQVRAALIASLKSGSNSNLLEDQGRERSALVCVPLFHVTGLVVVSLLSIIVGRKLVFMTKWDPTKALKLIQEHRITDFVGVPTMALELINHPDKKKYDTSSLTLVSGGGSPSPNSLASDIEKNFKNASPGQGYGLTETCAFTALTSSAQYLEKPTSCGIAVPGCCVEVWDMNSNRRLGPESIGRLMVKGASVMKGYWNNPKATTEAITPDGFFDTGDLGKLDKDGNIYILDRIKQLIIRGGENISTIEVESAVYSHPAVFECAAIGVAHPTLQEEVGIAIFPKTGQEDSLTLQSIRTACATLADFKKPRHLFVYKNQLPRGSTGKIDKRKIKEDINKGMVPRTKL